ncbi:MAG TPA: hypothetical protein VG889_14855 [Rhizomicrobium sp.]|nr:hypothetical protein [Rhizomicrobium sp.]
MSLTSASVFGHNHIIVPPNGPTTGSVGVTGGSGGSAVNKAGTIADMEHGDGTFAKTLETVNGRKVVDKTVDYADGTHKSVQRTITVNPDGSKTIVKVKDGKTTTIQESMARNEDGTFSLTKEITNAKGKTSEVTGTISRADGETDKTLTRTNAKGESETITSTTVRDGNVATHTRSGTGYRGNHIYDQSTWTTFA